MKYRVNEKETYSLCCVLCPKCAKLAICVLKFKNFLGLYTPGPSLKAREMETKGGNGLGMSRDGEGEGRIRR
jgi:hypothetical protein